MSEDGKSGWTLGQAIDAIVDALQGLDATTRASAIRAACDHLSIAAPQLDRRGSDGGGDSGTGGAPGQRPPSDIRSLKEAKQPTSSSEMAALVAYYLQEVLSPGERQTEVDVADMEKYFKQAGYPLPKVTRMMLINAKAAGYFESAGGGKFKLNPVGYNLIAHNLPRGSNPAPERRRAKKKAAKKSAKKSTKRP